MNLELIPSLTDVGGIIVEGYKRLTKASEQEKAGVGVPNNEDVYANVGVASIEEYVTMNVFDVAKNEMAVFELAQFNQPLRLESLYIDDPRSDSVTVEVFLPGNVKIMSQKFSKNRTPFKFPTVPLPPQVTIKVTALSDVKLIQLVLVPVVILSSVRGTKQGFEFNGGQQNG